MVKYFFDSYAVIELLKGNPHYTAYMQEDIVITIFNLTEIFWFALGEYSNEKSNEIYDKLRTCVSDIDDETLKESIKFKRSCKKKNLSYADCIGYAYANRNNLKFLTGDKEFENLNNVEFVK